VEFCLVQISSQVSAKISAIFQSVLAQDLIEALPVPGFVSWGKKPILVSAPVLQYVL
jgi:hypothetical protein